MNVLRSIALNTILIMSAFVITSHTFAADTTFIRELAKNKPRTVIVTGGENVSEVTTAISDSINRHGEFDHKNKGTNGVTVMSLAEAADAATKGQLNGNSIIFVFCGRHLKASDIPLPLTGLLPFAASAVEQRESLAQSTKDKDKPREPLFRVGLYAPDTTRLRAMYEKFLGVHAGNFRDLSIHENWKTNRLYIFSSPELENELKARWGRLALPNLWNDIQWAPLAARDTLKPDDLEEYTRLYLIDRSDHNTPVPKDAAKVLESQTTGDTTIVIAQAKEESSGEAMVVVSTPSRPLLKAYIKRYPNLPMLTTLPVLTEVKDLRRVTKTILVLPKAGSEVSPEQAEKIYTLLAADIRQNTPLSVPARGSVLGTLETEVEIQKIQGASGAALRQKLRNKSGVRYMWLLNITEFGGTTQYSNHEDRQTPEPPSFTEAEPQEPVQAKKESYEDFAKRVEQWRRDHDNWQKRRDNWRTTYEDTQVSWRVYLKRHEQASVHGLLQLWSLDSDGGTPVWEMECSGRELQEAVEKSETHTIRGFGNHPDSLSVPESTPHCAEPLLLAAVRNATGRALNELTLTALLPDATQLPPGPEPNDDKSTDGKAPLVADIDGNTITISAGSSTGVRINDRFLYVLKDKTIRDPVTGSTISRKILDAITLKVVAVELNAAECVVVSAADAPKIKLIQVGKPVEKPSPVAGQRK